ncbi:23S rRNA (adenine(2030)-N(6))-methyltransferase RlmJ [Gilvimarinus polysaccharolyticus]|uniref:23S rRNA (adenine(2030)-N(6))-methyltransferase RlmJ n=1 Tax=Gilvimarinus polysaccharolyticus TaxID=863921 RepID=UPI00067383BF|nr:23S rRNA (adenine(2030)-N(6))-methyltransferase RlmJ [Gilvimarinus polysaccharolyticus]
MLSYRHSYHAGNHADVIKHIVLVEILAYLGQKPAPFEYIDTHAGAGLYNLRSEHAIKLGEYRGGIGKLMTKPWPLLAPYLEQVKLANRTDKLYYYPGSPLIAQRFLRRQDRAWLFELHPSDHKKLSDNTKAFSNVQVEHADGLNGLLARIPPKSRRALVLIDPSYEVKSEYVKVIDAVIKAHKKFASGVYAIWYPVVEREQIDFMAKKLVRSGIKNIQRYELGLEADAEEKGHGMTASGLFVINPPWTLRATMQELLPQLQAALAEDDGFFKCDVLVDE